MVNTEAEADQLLAQLKAGADFGSLSKHIRLTRYYSFRRRFGLFCQRRNGSEFEELCWRLGINELGKVQTIFGWHVVKVTDKAEAQEASLEKDYAEIEDTLIQFLASEYLGHYLYRLEQEANIQILREGYR